MPGKGEQPKNYIELTESQIFEKIKEDLNPIQENLTEKRITVKEAKSELKKINEWIQGTNLETKDKKEIGKAFEKLIKLEKDIDENSLKDEVREIINLVETLTKKDLANLKQGIKQNRLWGNPKRPAEVQEGIKESSSNLDQTINDATEDKNPIARKIGERMQKLMS